MLTPDGNTAKHTINQDKRQCVESAKSKSVFNYEGRYNIPQDFENSQKLLNKVQYNASLLQAVERT